MQADDTPVVDAIVLVEQTLGPGRPLALACLAGCACAPLLGPLSSSALLYGVIGAAALVTLPTYLLAAHFVQYVVAAITCRPREFLREMVPQCTGRGWQTRLWQRRGYVLLPCLAFVVLSAILLPRSVLESVTMADGLFVALLNMGLSIIILGMTWQRSGRRQIAAAASVDAVGIMVAKGYEWHWLWGWQFRLSP